TFVYVTHDQIEAMSMADTIVLMNEGKIMQMDSPRKLYRDPDNLFAARFIGSPAMNIRKFGKEEYILGFRPEKGIISTQEPQGCYRTSGTVVAKEDLGSEIHYSVRDMYDDVSVIRSEEDDITVGEKVWIGAKPENIYLFGNDQLRIREDDPRYPDLCRQVLALQ
ncbi:MAG: TOBE domain-containing protein, partial [Lachnospira sp.]|nr:TOBE domain-containing protein [Lachnospira sp.]